MTYKKLNPEITFEKFLKFAMTLKYFKSITGREYLIEEWNESMMTFKRISTGKMWKMDIKDVHKAYSELTSFKTSDFKPYVNRTHSPALGLLIALDLLTVS